jgi:hypothetical protein
MNAQKLLAELRHRESKNLPPQVTLRALVPNHYINKLYHTDRGYINQVGSQYDVKLYALPGSGVRLTFVVGSPRSISNAWGHLLDFFLEHFPLTYGEVSTTLCQCFLCILMIILEYGHVVFGS